MYWLTWGTPDSTDRKGFWRLFCVTIVTFALALNDDLDLTIEAGSAALDQWDVGRQTHFIDVTSGIDIVERIEDELEAGKPIYIELRIFDIGLMCLQLDVGVEFAGTFLCDL